ncbi:MAG: hypothetical protein ACTSO9_18985 [Candidatus Helarchaeota archaeon]
MPECKICQRVIDSGDLCEYHELAKKNIENTYDYWNKAYGGITFNEYLKRISEHKNSGRWVQEVAIYLIENKKILE